MAVGIQVPDIQDTKPGIVTLRAEVSENFAVVEKSTYVYTQGSTGVEVSLLLIGSAIYIRM